MAVLVLMLISSAVCMTEDINLLLVFGSECCPLTGDSIGLRAADANLYFVSVSQSVSQSVSPEIVPPPDVPHTAGSVCSNFVVYSGQDTKLSQISYYF